MSTDSAGLDEQDCILLNSIPDGILLLDSEQRIRRANHFFERQFGVTPDRYLDQPLTAFFHPDHAQALSLVFSEVEQSRTPHFLEVRAKRGDDTFFDAEISVSVAEDGVKSSAQICTIRDITRRKESERQIVQERNLLRTIIDAVPDYIYVKDKDDRSLLSNRAHAQILGLADPADVVGKTDFDLFPRDLAARFQEEDRQILSGVVDQLNLEQHGKVSDDGPDLHTHTTKVPLRDMNDAIIGLVGVTRNIAALKTSEEAVRQSQERLELATRGAGIGVWEWNVSDYSMYWDDRMYAIHGLTRNELGGRPGDWNVWALHVHPDDRVTAMAVAAQALEGKPYQDFVYRIICPDRSIRYIRTSCQIVCKPDGQIQRIVGTNLDITPLKEAEAALRESQERLQLATQAAGLGIWDWDVIDDQLYWDDRMYEIYGLPRANPVSEAIGGNWDAWGKRLHPEDLERIMSQMGILLAGEQHIDTEYRIIRPDNTIRHISAHILIMRGSDGRALRMIGTNMDITDQVEMDAELRHGQERLKLAAEVAGLGVWEWDLSNGQFIVDDRLFDIFGWNRNAYSPGQSMLDQWLSTVYQDDLAYVKDMLAAAMKGTQDLDAEFRIVMPDKSIRYIRANSRRFLGADGRPKRMIGTAMDITPLRESESRLRESQERMKLAAEVAGLGVWYWDGDERTLVADDRLFAIFGRDRHEFEANWKEFDLWLGIVHPDDRVRVQAELSIAIEASQIRSSEFRIVMPDKSIRYIRANSRGFLGADGRPKRMIGTAIDITALRQSESALRISQERLTLAIKAAGLGIWDYNFTDNTYVWDDGTYTMYGITQEEAAKIDDPFLYWMRAVHPDDLPSVQKQLTAIANGADYYSSEFRVVLPDGAIRHLKTNGVIMRNEDGRPERMVGVHLDITALKEAELALRSALDQERELNDLKSRFVSTASHEFRTPLATILATTDTLTRYRDRMDASQIDARLEKIRHQVDHMKKLLEDVMQLERIHAGQAPFAPGMHDLTQLCQAVVEEFRSRVAFEDRIVFTSDANSLIFLYDEQLMRHVLVNLIENALQFSPTNTPVYVILTHNESEVALMVKDSGIGIPPEDLPRLFQPFHRAWNVGVVDGTGLGLSIANESVLRHGGKITVETTIDVGSTFTVTLPYKTH